MISIIFTAFFSLIGLLILHELSHFLVAKKFKVKVEEFGVGYPPRIFGKKIGETIYSLNLLPFGAFVRMPDKDFNLKPIWQRFLVIVAGVFSFWVFSTILIGAIMIIGAPVQISDNDTGFANPKVQILSVAPDSPAQKAGIQPGDIITNLKLPAIDIGQAPGLESVEKIKTVQEFIENHKGEEIIFYVERGTEVFTFNIIPRVSPPEGEGALGVALARIAIKQYSLYQAIPQSVIQTVKLTGFIIVELSRALYKAILGKPSGVQLMGPIGIMQLFVQSGSLGVNYFLQTIAVISLHLAIFNALPIPMVDGGKILFLILEKIRKKPFNEKIEERISAFFFVLLLSLMLFVTAKEIIGLF